MTLSLITKNDAEWSTFDYQVMSSALKLAKQALYTARPNPMVGCIIVKEKKIIGEGWHQKSGLAHAEVNALAQAGELAKGATCYVTLEPCAHTGKTGPCAKALINAGIKKVIAAMLDPNPLVAGKGFQLLLDAGIEVEVGLLEEQAKNLNRGFVCRFSKNRPWVTCKLAMSLDGRTALEDGASQWITGEAARFDVQKLRASQDAIITGIGTLLADNPSLNVRADKQDWYEAAKLIGFNQPTRVLLDKKVQAPESAKFFNEDANVLWFGLDFGKTKATDELKNNVQKISGINSLSETLSYLAQLGFNQVLLEAGHRLSGEFLKQGFIDELIIYMAPKIMGNNAMGLFNIQIENMLDTPKLKLTDSRLVGDDIRLTYLIDSKPISKARIE